MKKLYLKFLGLLSIFVLVVYSIKFNVANCVGPSDVSVSSIPTTLEESCVELDKILTPEEKENIKQSEHSFRTGYIGKLWRTPLGMMICREWLHEHKDETTALCKLLLDHGARFDGEMEINLKMFWVLLENYRYYLINGECVPCIENLMIDYWYYDFIFFNSDATEEQKNRRRADLAEAMERWKKANEAYKNRWTNVSKCRIL